MKMKSITVLLILFGGILFGQTTHQVCIAEVNVAAACNSTSGVFTPGNLTIEVGDQIQFTTHMILLGGYNGTHNIQFSGSPANNVNLAISTNILAPVTTVTTPPFTTPGVYPMQCANGTHCSLFAEIFSGWSCTGYSVTVVNSCTTDAIYTPTATTVCEGTTVNFTNSSISATSYSWKIDEVPFSSSTNTSYNFPTAGTFTIELIAVGAGGCIDSVSTSISVIEAAQAGSDNTASLCNDAAPIDLNTLVTGNNGVGTWSETTSSGQFNTSSGVFDPSNLAAGNYLFDYTVTGNTPCPNDISNFTIAVNQAPDINLNIGTNTIFLGDSIYVDFTALGAIGGTTYNWDFCDGNTSTSTSPFYYSWTTEGSTFCICVEMDNNNGCSVNICENGITVIDVTGVIEKNYSDIVVYPNPSKGDFNLDLSKLSESNIKIYLSDNLNRIVWLNENLINSNCVIPRNNLPSGLYFITVLTEGSRTVIPVVFE